MQDAIGVWHDWLCLGQEAQTALGDDGAELTSWLAIETEPPFHPGARDHRAYARRALGRMDGGSKPGAGVAGRDRTERKPPSRAAVGTPAKKSAGAAMQHSLISFTLRMGSISLRGGLLQTMQTFAAIDIGSNSCRLKIARVQQHRLRAAARGSRSNAAGSERLRERLDLPRFHGSHPARAQALLSRGQGPRRGPGASGGHRGACARRATRKPFLPGSSRRPGGMLRSSPAWKRLA